jgi:transcriptional regulator with XRE-family HTH domain
VSTGIPYTSARTIPAVRQTIRPKAKRGDATGTKAERAVARAAKVDAPDPTTVGGRLEICRNAKKLSQAAAARSIKISPQSLGELEHGESKQPAADTLLDMRDKLGYDPDYVIRGKGMPLLPNFEELAKEMALISIFRELRPDLRDEAVRAIQGLRRAQGTGPSKSDPFGRDAPGGDDD